MRDHAVPLHLTNTKTSIPATSFAGLASQRYNRTTSPRVLLVDDHVLQTLIEGRTHEDLSLHHLAGLPVIQDLVAIGMHAHLQHLSTQLLDLQVRIWSSIAQSSLSHADLSEDTLHQLRNRHTRRHSVWIHNQIRTQTRARERHILLIHQHSNCSLLTVTRAELVTDLGNALRHHANLDEGISIRVLVLPDTVNATRLCVLVGGRRITECVAGGIVAEVDNLADDYILLPDCRMENRNTILIHSRITGVLELARVVLLGAHKLLLPTRGHIAVLLILIHRVIQTAEQTAIHRRPIHDDRVLLVVATVAGNGYNRIHSERHLLHP